MRDPNARRWRAAALLLGAGWLVALVVACGGGGDDDAAAPAAGTAERPTLTGTGAPERPPPRVDVAQAAPTSPCVDTPLQSGPAATPAVAMTRGRAPASPEGELADEALALGSPVAATQTASPADPFEAQ